MTIYSITQFSRYVRYLSLIREIVTIPEWQMHAYTLTNVFQKQLSEAILKKVIFENWSTVMEEQNAHQQVIVLSVEEVSAGPDERLNALWSSLEAR